jgi:hypothetical protein
MKKFFMLLVVTLMFMTSCASTKSGITKAEYMSRAHKFDAEWAGKENTPAYRMCFPQFFNYLFTECKPIAQELVRDNNNDESEYWECADDALDALEECLDDQSR